MARPLRQISRSGIYHVILRGVNKQRIFEQTEDYEAFYRVMKFVQTHDTQRQRVDTPCFYLYSFCVMDNHVHLLIQPNGYELGRIMTRIQTAYAIYFNNTYERVGHLFQDRFKSEVVEDANYFYTLLHYIHNNPVKAGITRSPEQYPYSSFNELTRFATQKGLTLMGSLCVYPTDGNILGISQKDVCEYLLSETSEPEFKGIIGSLKVLTQSSDSAICRYLRAHLQWQTADEQDKAIVDTLLELTGVANMTEFQRLDRNTMRTALAYVRDSGASTRSISRLTGIAIGVIRYAKICIPTEEELAAKAERELQKKLSRRKHKEEIA